MRTVAPLAGLPAELRLILLEWDFIGVVPLGAPEDEYDCLIPALTDLVHRDATAEAFGVFLRTELPAHFGMSPDLVTPEVAARLTSLARGR